VTPDAIPNAYGDDPWLVAVRRVSTPLTSPYLASFLLVRALGRRTTNSVELVQATFDVVYDAAEKRTLPEGAWKFSIVGLIDRTGGTIGTSASGSGIRSSACTSTAESTLLRS
jgi:hypothetical protein